MFNPVVALAIACTKAVIVILFFMHVKYQSNLVKLTVAAGFFTFLVLITMTLTDYMSRRGACGSQRFCFDRDAACGPHFCWRESSLWARLVDLRVWRRRSLLFPKNFARWSSDVACHGAARWSAGSEWKVRRLLDAAGAAWCRQPCG